jgi:competence protein ComEA
MIALTKEERLVVVSLGLVLLLGISTNYFLKKNPITKRFFAAQKSDMPEHLKIDVNKATYDELAAIPYLGAKTAKNIIFYRDANGAFADLEDLKNVSGVGDYKFRTIQKYLKT